MKKIAAALLAAFLLLAVAAAQVNVAPIQNPRVQYFDQNGRPLAGGKIYTYLAGGSTPQATYTDSTGGSANANPVVLDSSGFGTIWLGPHAYKIVVQNSAGAQQWTVDGVTGNNLLISPVLTTPAISGGAMDGTVIGGTTPAAGTFTALNATSIPAAGPIGRTTPNEGHFSAINGVKASPTFSGTPQFDQPFVFSVGGWTPASVWGASSMTDALAAGMTVPPGATIYQASAVSGYIDNFAASPGLAGAVAGFFTARCSAGSTQCWAINPQVTDRADLGALPDIVMSAQENDINVTLATTQVNGIRVVGNFLAQPLSAWGVKVGVVPGQPGQWKVGYETEDGAIVPGGSGLSLGTDATSATSPSTTFGMLGKTSGVYKPVFQQASAAGEYVVTPTTGNRLNGLYLGLHMNPSDIPTYTLHAQGNYGKTDVVHPNLLAFLGSAETLSGAPFGLRISGVGAASTAGRTVNLQTTEYGSVDGGVLGLQPSGGIATVGGFPITVYVGQITTTGSSPDTLTVAGLTAAGHCMYSPENATGGQLMYTSGGMAIVAASGYAALYHPTSPTGGVFNIFCAVQ